jgi:CheY-like chemotaxis protein
MENGSPVQKLKKHLTRIAIVDDDKESREIIEWQLKDGGFDTIVIDEPVGLDEFALAQRVAAVADAAVCDHRLMTYGLAMCYGSSLVAQLYSMGIPSVLETQFFDSDKDVSIRKFRDKIPVVLRRGERNITAIAGGLLTCLSEIKGELIESRRPHRTLVCVEDIKTEDGETVIDVTIPAWGDDAVRLPVSLFPSLLRDTIRQHDDFIAYVNIGADKSEDLYFKNFERAPDPDDAVPLT